MDYYLGKSEDILVVVEELESCLRGPTDVAGRLVLEVCIHRVERRQCGGSCRALR